MPDERSRMPIEKPQDQAPVYTFLGDAPGDGFRDIARIHHKEAKELLERAQAAQAEDRQHEARLLMDLSIAREERAQEFDRAARGEGSDPIVTEILDWQKDICENYTPHTMEFLTKEELAAAELARLAALPPPGRFVRALDWIALKKEQFTRRVLAACFFLLQGFHRPGGNQ